MPPTTATTVLVVVSALFGLIIGSFLNVVVHRAPRGISIVRPGSSCPRCGALLGGRENVPVLSWLMLRGRCRHCGEPISPRYPLVELVTGAGFAVMAWAVGPAAALPPLLVVVAATIAASVIDHDGLVVPRMVLIVDLCGAIGLIVVSTVDHGAGRLAWGAIGAGAAGLAVLPGLVEHEGPAGPARWSGVVGSVAVLGWCSGWLWPAGGLILAAWAAVTTLVGPILARRLAAPRRGVDPAHGHLPGRAPGLTQGRWLLVASFGAYWVLVAGAAVHGP
ncbi:MAG TPA: prepilin peptidase [Acidimicrobiales bacterium]|nr:prepilin peptidase [Acidimicrobiales bacterium]